MNGVMTTAILVCALAATALAAPKYSRGTKLDRKLTEHVRVAEQAWDTAERETDPAKQTALWEQAAMAFGDIDGDPVDAKVKREAAYAAILAWKNALNVDPRVKRPTERRDPEATPRPLPARELKLLGAVDRYLAYADPKDVEVPGLLFIKANTHQRFEQLEVAIPMFRVVIDRFPEHEVAGYAAQLVLDAYNRLGKYDELVKFAGELANNPKLTKKHPDLAALLARLQQQAGRKRLEVLEKAAHAEQDPDTYAAVGAGYLELYHANPKQPGGDELLYNAGVSYEKAFSYDAALAAYALLQKTYASSKIAPRAIGRAGQIYARRAMYEKAAEQLERYAMLYAGEKDAYQALSDAVYYRKALGDRDKAIANTNLFVKLFGAKRPREVADAMWSLTALYESADPARAITHLQEYLKRYATKGPPERVTIAHAKLGQLLWKQSCSVPGLDGLCVKLTESAKATCGPVATRVAATVGRDPRKAKLALASFADAIKEYERRPINDPAARYFYAEARLATADAALEAYLALPLPRDLDFDGAPRAASVKRFSDWLEEKRKAGSGLMRQYEAVLFIKDVVGAITASARVGMISQSLASTLLTGELPRGVRSGAKLDAYCNAITEVAAPLEARTIDAFAVCLAKSTELGWFGESSRYCEHELTRLRPEEFPAAIELRAKPTMVAPVIDLESLPPGH